MRRVGDTETRGHGDTATGIARYGHRVPVSSVPVSPRLPVSPSLPPLPVSPHLRPVIPCARFLLRWNETLTAYRHLHYSLY